MPTTTWNEFQIRYKASKSSAHWKAAVKRANARANPSGSKDASTTNSACKVATSVVVSAAAAPMVVSVAPAMGAVAPMPPLSRADTILLTKVGQQARAARKLAASIETQFPLHQDQAVVVEAAKQQLKLGKRLAPTRKRQVGHDELFDAF